MYFVNTLGNLEGPSFAAALDDCATEEYRAKRVGQPGPPPPWGEPQLFGELWLLAIARPAVEFKEWVVYGITSDPDIPGWPYRTGDYVSGPLTAEDLAQPYVDAGYEVVLRHYSNFAPTFDAADVALT